MKKQAMDFSNIEKAIVTIKGQKVIIDSDVAKIYGVETREVNQAIKNNPDKFPVGYIVETDKDELIKNFDKFKNIKNYPGTPKAFTEKKHLFIPGNGFTIHGHNIRIEIVTQFTNGATPLQPRAPAPSRWRRRSLGRACAPV